MFFRNGKLLSKGALTDDILATFIKTMLKRTGGCRVANRPGRIEPRVVKKLSIEQKANVFANEYLKKFKR